MRSHPHLARTLRSILAVVAAGFGGLGEALPADYPVGTDAGSVDLRSVPGSVPYAGGRAVPLRGAKPAWLTSALEQQVLASGGIPVPAPFDAPLPSVIGIRPGAWMVSPAGCTMSFVFVRSGSLAIGTAGHCVEEVGQEVVLLTLAPGGASPVLIDVGVVLAMQDNGIGEDFALVSIRDGLRSWVSPTTAVIGGPCGSYTGWGPEIVVHYGHGLAIGTGGTPRAGLALTWKADSFGWAGLAIFGDSGSPVNVSTLRAAGVLTHLVVSDEWLPSFIAGTRIGKALQIAPGWSLLSSPLCLGSGSGLTGVLGL